MSTPEQVSSLSVSLLPSNQAPIDHFTVMSRMYEAMGRLPSASVPLEGKLADTFREFPKGSDIFGEKHYIRLAQLYLFSLSYDQGAYDKELADENSILRKLSALEGGLAQFKIKEDDLLKVVIAAASTVKISGTHMESSHFLNHKIKGFGHSKNEQAKFSQQLKAGGKGLVAGGASAAFVGFSIAVIASLSIAMAPVSIGIMIAVALVVAVKQYSHSIKEYRLDNENKGGNKDAVILYDRKLAGDRQMLTANAQAQAQAPASAPE